MGGRVGEDEVSCLWLKLFLKAGLLLSWIIMGFCSPLTPVKTFFSLAVPCLDSLLSTALYSQPVTPRESPAHPHTRETQVHKLLLLPLSPSHFLPFHHQGPGKRPKMELSLPSRQPTCSQSPDLKPALMKLSSPLTSRKWSLSTRKGFASSCESLIGATLKWDFR